MYNWADTERPQEAAAVVYGKARWSIGVKELTPEFWIPIYLVSMPMSFVVVELFASSGEII